MDDFQKILSSIKQDSAGGSGPSGQGATSNPLIDVLTERLTQQGQGIATSSSSAIQQEIQNAMRDTQAAGEATAARLQSERGREVGFATDRASAQFTTALEGRSGYATQVAALKELTETTEKSIRDLDGRYQEALMANDANTASQMSALRMQKLEFLQEQEQQFYSNLFSLAGLAEQQASREQQASQFERGLSHDQNMMRERFGFDWAMFEKQNMKEERQMLQGLAAQYGLSIGEGETIDSMISKVSPLVSEERALELERMRAQIRESNAQAARAMRQEPSEQPFDAATAEILATAFMNGETSFLAGLRTNQQYSAVASTVQKKTAEEKSALEEIASKAGSQTEFLQTIDSMTQGLTDPEKARVTNAAMNIAANTNFKTPPKTKATPLPTLLMSGAGGWSSGTRSFLEWVTGIEQTNF